MKNQNFFLPGLMAFLLLAGCEMSENPDHVGELEIIKDGQVVLDLSDIEYYDFSSHVIYLNENNRLDGDFDKLQDAAVTIDGENIYSLRIHELHSSTFYPGPHIYRMMDMFGDFAFRVRFGFMDDGESGTPNDPRTDARIRNVLKKHGKLREGLSLEILSVSKTGADIKATLRLKNMDPVSYYHLDPGKMGKGLFHYFTNGLTYLNPDIPEYVYDKTAAEKPEPWNYWTRDWLSEIQGNESKVLEFTYSLGAVPQGQDLKFFFDFPSPELSITNRSDLELQSGRVWLGSVGDTKVLRF